MKLRRITIGLLVLAFAASLLALTGCPPADEGGQEPMLDEPLPPEPDATAGGGEVTIDSIGSTTVLPIAEAWAKAYHEAHPNVAINVSGGGSGNGIKALIDGTADIANSSRPIKDEEVQFAKQKGVDPVEHVVAYDCIAVVVHPDNPIESLTIEQLSDIYSGEITSWDELGVSGMGEIILISRDSASGTYESWKEMVIQMGGEAEDRDYAPAALKNGSNKGIRETVAQTPSAIGYIGIGYINDDVKPIDVVPLGGGDAVAPTSENVQSGEYPVSRELYMYTDGEPTGVLKQYLDWGMSEEGQRLVEEQGFVPVK